MHVYLVHISYEFDGVKYFRDMTEIFFMNAPIEKFILKTGEEIKVNSLVARPIKIKI